MDTVGRFNLPFPLLPPSNRRGGGGPRRAPKGGTLSHLSYWNLLYKILDVAAIQLRRIFWFFRVFSHFFAVPLNPHIWTAFRVMRQPPKPGPPGPPRTLPGTRSQGQNPCAPFSWTLNPAWTRMRLDPALTLLNSFC